MVKQGKQINQGPGQHMAIQGWHVIVYETIAKQTV